MNKNNNNNDLNEKKFNLQPEVMVYTSQLEAEFENYRVFGDERDLAFFDNCLGESKFKCVLNKISERLRPDLYMQFSNVILICANCVKSAIKNFKDWREIRIKNSDTIEMLTPDESENIRKKLVNKLSSFKFKIGDVVKVRFDGVNKKGEYMWVRIINKKNKTTYSGVLLNKPLFRHKNNLKLNDTVEFRINRIYDVRGLGD